MKTFAIAALSAAAAVALPATVSAQTYDIRSDYGASVFSYGSGTGGGSLTPFANSFAGGCFGGAQIACKANEATASTANVPVAAVNTGATTVNFATTVDLPNSVLLLHPGFGTGTDAVLRFTATRTADYLLSGIFSRLDNVNGGGDGVNISIFGPSGASLFSGVLANTPQGVSSSFSNLVVSLSAGQSISYVVNNGDGAQPVGTYYDSTGLSGTITAVPEPASWALMILGFGVAGHAMRRRARTAVAFA